MAVLAAISISTTAFAAPADVSSTSNFTITVVEETLGITITGSTTQSDVISKTDGAKQMVAFPNIQITNSGNTKGRLYANMGTPSGIKYVPISPDEGDLVAVSLYANQSAKSFNLIDTERYVALQESQDTDGDPNWVGPGEELKSFDVQWIAQGKFPTGNITVPIKWTMKAN